MDRFGAVARLDQVGEALAEARALLAGRGFCLDVIERLGDVRAGVEEVREALLGVHLRLADLYANGEITTEEFRRRMDELR